MSRLAANEQVAQNEITAIVSTQPPAFVTSSSRYAIPYLLLTEPDVSVQLRHGRAFHMIQVYTASDMLSTIAADIVTAYTIKEVVIFYDSENGKYFC